MILETASQLGLLNEATGRSALNSSDLRGPSCGINSGVLFMIRTKRVYDLVEQSDGARFLVDHLWPRGLKKEALQVDQWIKLVSPSNRLRAWFGHEPAKWKEFQRRYFAELDEKPETWKRLLEAARLKDVTLVFSARDIEHNNAVALQEYLEGKLASKPRRKRTKIVATRFDSNPMLQRRKQ